MQNKINSIDYMKEYLRFATEFEKHVYFWSGAMDAINSAKQSLYKERENYLAAQNALERDLALYEIKEQRGSTKQQTELKHAKERKRTVLAVLIAVVVLILVGIQQQNPKIVILSVLAIPVLFIYYLYLRSDIKARKSYSGHTDNKKELLNGKIQIINDALKKNVDKENSITQQQENIHRELMSANKNLRTLYSENILPVQYRNLEAVSTMYEYLITGRCNMIEGHGGIFDTYSFEKILLEQLAQLVKANRTLERMEYNQRLMIREIRSVNNKLEIIKGSLDRIEESNKEIANNTAICAKCAQEWNEWRQRHFYY